MTWDIVLGYLTGLYLVAPPMDPATLVRTVIGTHALDCLMCRLVAHNNGYPKNLWTLLGFIFGVWAVAIVIVLPRRRAAAGTDQPSAICESRLTPRR